MLIKKYHIADNPLPAGFQIFEERIEVAGIHHRKEAAKAFIKSHSQWLELEREPTNLHDENAIKIFGCNKDFLGIRRRFIGYIPSNIAKRISKGGWYSKIRARLEKTYLGEDDFVEVTFQIIGPAGKKYEYNPPKVDPSAHYTEAVDQIKRLKRENNFEAAIELLWKCIDQTELESNEDNFGVAPWYYEQLAMIFRKQNRYSDEVEVLERYAKQKKAPGTGPKKLAERLKKARQLLG